MPFEFPHKFHRNFSLSKKNLARYYYYYYYYYGHSCFLM